MAGSPCSPTANFCTILGITKSSSLKEIGKAYKSLVSKWHPDKHPSNKKEAEDKLHDINDAYDKAVDFKRLEKEPLKISNPILLDHDHHKSKDDEFFSCYAASYARSMSRRSKTPNPRSFSRLASKSTTPTLSRNMSQRVPSQRKTTSPLFSREASNKFTSYNDINDSSSPLSRNMSKRSTTPIFFSQSIARRKPPPIERPLHCTLEELLNGCVKKFKITRDVIKDIGIVQEEEILKINIKPGWKKGTKIMFEGKGDEKPGYVPADIVFLIDENKHPLFRRDDDDLEIAIEISLIQALTGCSISIPLLGGENMTLIFERDIIYHGFEKVVHGQGMPCPKQQGKRGDLRISFLVKFPKELNDEQRSDVVKILQDCLE